MYHFHFEVLSLKVQWERRKCTGQMEFSHSTDNGQVHTHFGAWGNSSAQKRQNSCSQGALVPMEREINKLRSEIYNVVDKNEAWDLHPCL